MYAPGKTILIRAPYFFRERTDAFHVFLFAPGVLCVDLFLCDFQVRTIPLRQVRSRLVRALSKLEDGLRG